MLSKIYTAAVVGVDAKIIEVEVDIQRGIHKFFIVGLGDKAVQESKERVTAAIKNSSVDFVYKRITVNLAPADLPKTGPAYDFPIALGILAASGQIEFDFSDSLIIGELSLEGSLKNLDGILAIAHKAFSLGFKKLYLPSGNANEASLIDNLDVFPVKSIDNFVEYTRDRDEIQKHIYVPQHSPTLFVDENDISDVKGQEHAKQAIEIAAAGAHNLLMTGVPGSGKTFLAKTIPSILPSMTIEESIEVTKIHSCVGLVDPKHPLICKRPFRCPHHTSSNVALVGGGNYPKPGEISLAHRGVLFLDEFPEFSRASLESLRQPIEDRQVTISRASGSLRFPSNFILVAAMNPCKCGFRGDKTKPCTCNQNDYENYKKKISGPILDRIDLQIFIDKVNHKELESSAGRQTSAHIKQKVQNARDIQLKRYKKLGIFSNSELGQKYIYEFIRLTTKSKEILRTAVEKLNLTARSYFRILKVSRTIADLDNKEEVEDEHVIKALSFRLEGI
jgi:magnesium chelatase family protein